MKGAFKKHPERKRARENEPTDIPELGKPPDYLNEFERAAWLEIVEMCPDGVVRKSDEMHVAIMSRLWAAWKVGAIDGAALKQLQMMEGQMGMNPSDRSKVSAPKKRAKNKFEDVT